MNIGELLVMVGNFVTSCGDEWNMMKARQDRLAREAGVNLDVPERPVIEITDEMREVIIAERPRYNETDWLRLNGPRDQLCVRYNLTRHQVRGVLSQHNRAVNNGNGNGHGQSNGSSEREDAPAAAVVTSPAPSTEAPSAPVVSEVPTPESSPEPEVVVPPEPSPVPEPAPASAPEPACVPVSDSSPKPRAAEDPQTRTVSSSAPQIDLSAITLNVNIWPKRAPKSGSTTPTAKEYEPDEVDLHIMRLLKNRKFESTLSGKFRECRRLTRYQFSQLKDTVLAEAPNSEPAAPEVPLTITADPTTWPEIPPSVGYREIDDTDREIVHQLVLAGVYEARRKDVMQKRILRRQQVAGILSVLSRTRQNP